MAPSGLSPKLKRGFRVERHRSWLLRHPELGSVASRDFLEDKLRKIGQLLSDSERLMLNAMMARSEVLALHDEASKTKMTEIIRSAGQAGVALHEVSFMVDAETFYLYDEDGFCTDHPSENEPWHLRRQIPVKTSEPRLAA
jgi:hypothetical protein